MRVSLLPSFAANWFAPRLGWLAAEVPNTNIVLHPNLRVVDLDAYEADLAIRFEMPAIGLCDRATDPLGRRSILL